MTLEEGGSSGKGCDRVFGTGSGSGCVGGRVSGGRGRSTRGASRTPPDALSSRGVTTDCGSPTGPTVSCASLCSSPPSGGGVSPAPVSPVSTSRTGPRTPSPVGRPGGPSPPSASV